MSDLLIPIAVSSQLDVSGEERIHAAGYTAFLRAVWTPPPLYLLGDVPGGAVGDTGSTSYTLHDGYVPYGDITVQSGSIPPGAVINVDGSVTYTFTTAGTYNWVMQGVDANGNIATLNDTAVITNAYRIIADIGAFNVDSQYGSPEGTSYTFMSPSTTGSGGTVASETFFSFSGNGVYFLFNGQNLRRSTDGINWPVTAPSLVVFPGRGCYDGTVHYIPNARDPALHKRSYDNGLTWENVSTPNDGVTDYSGVYFSAAKAGEIAIMRQNYSAPLEPVVRRSIDHGTTWTTIARPTEFNSTNPFGPHFFWDIKTNGSRWMLSAGPNGWMEGLTPDNYVWYRDDLATGSWIKSTNWPVGIFPEKIFCIPGTTIWFITYSAGTYRRSADNGVTWTEITPNVSMTEVDTMAYVEATSTMVMGGAGTVKLAYSTDQGLTWTAASGVSGIVSHAATYNLLARQSGVSY